MKIKIIVPILIVAAISACNNASRNSNLDGRDSLHYELVDVKINDSFWSPKLTMAKEDGQ